LYTTFVPASHAHLTGDYLLTARGLNIDSADQSAIRATR
jgi:hypothetical protein